VIGDTFPADHTLWVQLNATGSVVSQARADLGDVRVVRVGGAGPQEIPRHVVDYGDTLRVFFKPVEGSGVNALTNVYWVYYGNALAAPPLVDLNDVYLWAQDFEAEGVGTSVPFGFQPADEDDWTIADVGSNKVYEAIADGTTVAGLDQVGGFNIVLETKIRFIADNVANHAGVVVQSGNLALEDLAGIAPNLQLEQDRLQVAEFSQGTESWVNASPVPLSADTWYDLRVLAGSVRLEFLVDNVEVGTALVFGGGGGLALYGVDAQAQFDDVRVRTHMTGDPGANLGIEEGRCQP
jgi:hypothetical protein